MDALILTCGTGGGHNAAAHAVEEELIRRGHQVDVINPYTLQSESLTRGIDNTYISLVRKSPRTFGLLYQAGNLYRRLPFRSPVYHVNGRMNTKLEAYLAEHSYDVIIATHLFAAEILTNMKHHGIRLAKTFYVATDYTCIPFTEETDCDYYVIPAKELTEEFAGYGIPTDRMYPLGIPTSASFAAQLDRAKMKEKLGLDQAKQYILITGGSMGAGNLKKVIATIYVRYSKLQTMRMIVICGNNEPLYQELESQYGKELMLVRHTTQMADYVAACELLITKPGGLSSTEAAVAGCGLIHITPIPGCETKNAHFFAERGMSIYVKSVERELIPAVERLTNATELAHMRKQQKCYINKRAAADLCELAESQQADIDATGKSHRILKNELP